MGSRFGGIVNRTALTSVESYTGVITRVKQIPRGALDKTVLVDVRISTGKTIYGVVYSRGTDKPEILSNMAVQVNRIGGRWCVL